MYRSQGRRGCLTATPSFPEAILSDGRSRNFSARAAGGSATLVPMRPNLFITSALLLAAVSQFASAQASTSVASRLAAQNALFDESWQTNLKINPLLATAVGD